MTNAPYLAMGARTGYRYGNTELADAIVSDGLWCAFDACLMGGGTERYNAGGITRVEIDPEGLFPDMNRKNQLWEKSR